LARSRSFSTRGDATPRVGAQSADRSGSRLVLDCAGLAAGIDGDAPGFHRLGTSRTNSIFSSSFSNDAPFT